MSESKWERGSMCMYVNMLLLLSTARQIGKEIEKGESECRHCQLR